MANIAVDATRTESVRTGIEDPYTFSYTPTTTPRGIVVTAIHSDNNTDHIASITYGGVTMQRVVTAQDSTTEQGRSYIYFLGKNVPTGTQTVSVDLNSATTDDIQFVVFGLNLSGTAADIVVIDSDLVEGNTTNPSVLMSVGGRHSVSVAAYYFGGSAAPPANVNMTNLHTHDFTAQFGSVDMQTTPGTGNFTCSYSGSDDTGLAVAAFTQKNANTQTVAATGTYTAALPRTIGKPVAATTTTTVALATATAFGKSIAAEATIGAALSRNVGKPVAATATLDAVLDAVEQGGATQYPVAIAIAGTPEGWVGT